PAAANDGAPPAETPTTLAVVVATKAAKPADKAVEKKLAWSKADLEKVKGVSSSNPNKPSRETWDLREVTKTLVGPKARIVALVEKAWKDAGMVPSLWVNRRGLFKFTWTAADGKAIEGAEELRDVRRIEIVDGE